MAKEAKVWEIIREAKHCGKTAGSGLTNDSGQPEFLHKFYL